jgi:nucleoside-diphosphate-sugar epimerase
LKGYIADVNKTVWTSVTALATAHVKALIIPEASNKRFLVTNGDYDMQELADILHSSPAISAEVKKRIPIGSPGTTLAGTHYKVENSKAKRILGMEEPSLKETVVALVGHLLEMEKKSKLY